MRFGRPWKYAALRAALLGTLLLITGCQERVAGGSTGPKAEAPRSVRLVQAESGALPRVVVATGTLAAEDSVVLNTKVAGRLDQLPVDLGSVVRRGDVVAVLDLTDFELRVRQAETTLRQARARLGVPLDGSADDLDADRTALVRQALAVLEQSRLQRERALALHRENILSKAELDQAQSSWAVAEARLQEAREEVRHRRAVIAERRSDLALAEQQLHDATVRAPFDGVVQERHLSIGAYLDVGAAVVTIVRVDPLRLRLPVPERDTTRVQIGQTVRIALEGDTRATEGRVARISPAVDESTRTLMIEAEVPNTDGAFRPGNFVRAEIVVDPDEQAILVPAEAIVTFAGVTRVLGVADGRIVEKRIVTGRRLKDRVEVLEGLAAGEQVVAAPGTLIAGQPVVVEH